MFGRRLAMARPDRAAKPSLVQSEGREREGPGSAFAGVVRQLDSAHAPVAQLDRASVYGTEGREFESLRARLRKPRYGGVFLSLGQGEGRRIGWGANASANTPKNTDETPDVNRTPPPQVRRALRCEVGFG